MPCQVCKKARAEIHITIMENGKPFEAHVCAGCYMKDGEPKRPSPRAVRGKCPGCGMTWRKIEEASRVGCARCYSTFGKAMTRVLMDIHKASAHVGKHPGRHDPVKTGTILTAFNVASKLRELKLKLDEAVLAENYEAAAKIRDEMKKLEKSIPT